MGPLASTCFKQRRRKVMHRKVDPNNKVDLTIRLNLLVKLVKKRTKLSIAE